MKVSCALPPLYLKNRLCRGADTTGAYILREDSRVIVAHVHLLRDPPGSGWPFATISAPPRNITILQMKLGS